MTKVAIDIRTNHQTGVYRYSLSLIEALIPLTFSDNIQFHLVYYWELPLSMKATLLELQNWELVHVKKQRVFSCHEPVFCQWLMQNEIDLYYTTNYMLDLSCPIPYIYTIHDLIRLKHPNLGYDQKTVLEKYGQTELDSMRSTVDLLGYRCPHDDLFLNYFWSINQHLAVNSYQIATVSQTVRQDIRQLLNVPLSKTVVISGAVDDQIFSTEIKPNRSRFLKNVPINGDYCLYVGLSHKHKRIEALLEVFSECLLEIPLNVTFVFVCQHREHLKNIMALAKNIRIESHILCLEAVNDCDLSHLYAGARAYVTASIDEGFGLSVQEALSCGTEVIVPDTPIMRETLNDCGHFYPVQDLNCLRELLISAYCGALKNKADKFISPFSWSESARKMMALFVDFANQKETSSRSESSGV